MFEQFTTISLAAAMNSIPVKGIRAIALQPFHSILIFAHFSFEFPGHATYSSHVQRLSVDTPGHCPALTVLYQPPLHV